MICRYVFSWLIEVSDVCKGNHPLEGGSPKEYYLIKIHGVLVKGPAGWIRRLRMPLGQGRVITADYNAVTGPISLLFNFKIIEK